MNVKFVAQPHAKARLGDFLVSGFSNKQWTQFRAAIAFVKQSGTKHIYDALLTFGKGGGVATISAGVDAGVTSAEGLLDLVRAVGDGGSVFVFHNAGTSTFHPKIYLFKGRGCAELLIGSGNLTEGGLYTNYEAGIHLQLDLATDSHARLLADIEQTLDEWSTPTDGLCYALDEAFIAKMVERGDLPDEEHTKAVDDKELNEQANDSGGEKGFFRWLAVPRAPRVARPTPPAGEHPAVKAIDDDEDDSATLKIPDFQPVPAQPGAHRIFLMTLQRTDVGVGQTTAGAQRRSPEIFIPLIARNFDPVFWGWPHSFVADREWAGPVDAEGRGKMDRADVMMRMAGGVYPVSIWYNPDKRDVRIRSEHIRSAGTIGDILYVERADGSGGYSYYVDVIPSGSVRYDEFIAHCTREVRNSKKRWGYL